MHHDRRMTAIKIARRLDVITPRIHRHKYPLAPFHLKPLPAPSTVPTLADDGAWTPIPPMTRWGGRNLNFVLRGEFAIPPHVDFARPVALHLPIGNAGDFSHPEALVYLDGEPYATIDRHHQEIRLGAAYHNHKNHTLMLHGWTGRQDLPPEVEFSLVMHECALVEVDLPTREFITLARMALQAAELLDALEPAKTRLLNALDAAFKVLDTREPLGEAFYATLPAAMAALQTGIQQAGPALDTEIIAAGHAHIDVAWLWTLGQTRHKAGRTFHTVLRLMEEFPAYHFTQSQPQLYAYIAEDYPHLLPAIQERVKEGRWEPIGGMWVEADCNISGPESLARQLMLGRGYFRDTFGVEAESPVLWLPDVFGYAWNLPQLIKLAGMDYFFTIKIGWNLVNKLPYDSFWWQGLDGTQVLTHFSTSPSHPWHGGPDLMASATYNAELDAFTALGSWAKLQHKEAQRVMLMSYGYGDGGGGPTREMNENALVLADFPALPRLKQGKVLDFFRQLEAESGAHLPTWNAELYLEVHRGTYTNQARNKRANRKSEFLLHDAEFLATFAALLNPDFVYPQTTINAAWRLVCLNQFHDIIPGSSIGEVYEESRHDYTRIAVLGETVRDTALAVLQTAVGGDVVVVNPTGFERDDLIFWGETMPTGQGIVGAHLQAIEGGTLIGGITLPPYSATALSFISAAESIPTDAVQVGDSYLENAYLRIELNAAGDITRIWDKTAAREVLPRGAVANQFLAFEDRPHNWDAWDIDIYYDDKVFYAEPADVIRVIEAGPLRATLEIQRRILNSPYTQRISLVYNRPQVDIDTTITWNERHILLKVAFPVDVLSPTATYEIQWGSVERPTHRNTSWDWARFETCAQKWVDLSEGGYGVALLNDCKYGHDIQANVIRLTLLRSSTYPDPMADAGEHRFAYSLYPHADTDAPITNADIARRAYLLNDPTLAVEGTYAPITPIPAFISASPNAVIETIKQAEDGHGIIVRLYECNRQRGRITLTCGFPMRAATVVNLLEEPLVSDAALILEGNHLSFYLKPFQIATLRLMPAITIRSIA